MILQIVELLKQKFPELKGRVIPVSDVNPFNAKSVLPTLPLGLVGLVSANGDGGSKGATPNMVYDVGCSLLFEPERYKFNGVDTPFFAYYDYQPALDRVLTMCKEFFDERRGTMEFRRLVVETDEFGVMLVFELRVTGRWVQPAELAPLPIASKVKFNVNIEGADIDIR